MTVDRYNYSRRVAQGQRDLPAQVGGRLADTERDALRIDLTDLIRTVRDARTQSIIVPGGLPVTYDDARKTYWELMIKPRTIYALSSEEIFRDVRGALRTFEERERPLLIRDPEAAAGLTERYNFRPVTYSHDAKTDVVTMTVLHGREAATVLSGIVSGGLRGRTDSEPTPVHDAVQILRDTFEPDTARDLVIGAIATRQERMVKPLANVGQERTALVAAVGELSSFSGEQVVQSLSRVMSFAGQQGDGDLLTASAFSLQQFTAGNSGNREAVEYQMDTLRNLFHELPNGIGRKLLGEILQSFVGQPVRRRR